MSGNSSGSFLILAVLALPILLIVFQRRAMKRQVAQVQDQLALGAEIMTHSGAYGIVRALREDYVILELTPGVETKWARAAIGRVVPPAEEPEPTGTDAGLDTPPTAPDQP